MKLQCPGCKETIRWWQKRGHNGHWHVRCITAWKDGYDTASNVDEKMNKRLNLPTAGEIYMMTTFPVKKIPIKTIILN